MKKHIITSDRELRRILAERLAAAFPGSQLHPVEDRLKDKVDWEPDLACDLVLPSGKYHFLLEVKTTAHATDVAQLEEIAKRSPFPPLLATVRLTDSVFAECRRRRVACFDCNGRSWVSLPSLSISHDTNDKPYRFAQREPDPFSPKSQRLARLFLNRSSKIWGQTALAHQTGLSVGLVSRLLDHYEKQGWAEGRRNDWRLANRDALLNAWRAVDRWARRVELQEYDLFGLEQDQFAGLFYRNFGHATPIAYTQWLAASLRFPYGNIPIVSTYCGRFPTEQECGVMGLRQVTGGGKVWLFIPRDEGVFLETRSVNGIPLVSDAQIYLDLLQVGLRGPDQAQALREWEGFGR